MGKKTTGDISTPAISSGNLQADSKHPISIGRAAPEIRPVVRL